MTSNSKPDGKYPARKVVLAEDEVVIRAIVSEEWEEDERGSPSIFRRPNTSVTRINPISLAEGISIVKQSVEKPGRPARDLRGVGRISVALIKKVGATPVPVRKPGPCIYMQVWEEPTEEKAGAPANPYHAEIVAYDDAQMTQERKAISLGYSRMLSKALHVFSVDSSGKITGESPPLEWDKADDEGV